MSNPNQTQNPGFDGLEAFLGENVRTTISLSPSQSLLVVVLSYKGKRQYKGKNGDYEKLEFEVKVVSDNLNVYTGLEGSLLLSTALYPQIRRALTNKETCWKVTRGRVTELSSFPAEFCASKLGGGQA